MRITARRAILAALMAVSAASPSAQAQDVPPSPSKSTPDALRAAAEAIDPLGKAAAAEAAWQTYLKALEAADGPVADQALALNRMADSRYYQQNMQGALQASLEAKRRLEAAGQTEGEPMADTLANVGTMYGAVGQSELELPMQEQSLAIRKRLYGPDPVNLPPGEAKLLGLGYLNYANALYSGGQFSAAADLVQLSLDGLIAGELRDATLFVAMSSGANMLSDAGRQVEALELAQRGVATATDLLPEGHPFIGFAQATLAKVLLHSDRFEEAQEPARRAVDILAGKLGPNNRNTVTALHNLGVILARLGRFEEAIPLMMSGLDAMGALDPGETVNQLASASNAAHEAGDDGQAMELAQRAVAIAATLPPEDRKALKGLVALALRHDDAGDTSAALQGIEAAAAWRAAAGDTRPDPSLELQRGLFAIKAGDRDGGWARAVAGTRALEADIIADAQRLELGADLTSYYESILQMAEAAFEADRPDDALRAFELAGWGVNSRMRQLLALKTSVSGDPVLAAKVSAFETGIGQLRLLNRERAALLVSDKTDAAAQRAAQIGAQSAALAQLRDDLATAIPDFGRWLAPASPSLAQVQARLQDDEAILIAMPARARTFTMVITADSAVMAYSNLGRPKVRALVSDLRAALDGGAQVDPARFARTASALYDIVLPAKAAAALAGRSRVAVVTSDALSRLPFAVLIPKVPAVDQQDFRAMDWLVKAHAFSIALTPSAAFAQRDASNPASRTSTSASLSPSFQSSLESSFKPSFLGVGAPSLTGTADPARGSVSLFRGGAVALDDLRALSPLPASAGEIARVAAISSFTSRVALTGDDATERRLRLASGSDYGVLLFATHGLMDGEVAGLTEPALVLTPPAMPGGADNDGLLLASEIGAMGLSADFVILSACNSAAGRNATAPAYTGLANAFLGSGARGLLLSHWRVRDDAAAFLSAATVERSLSGMSPAAALRAAQLALISGQSDIANSANPSVWAPFVLVER